MDTTKLPSVMLGIRNETPGWTLLDIKDIVTPTHCRIYLKDCYFVASGIYLVAKLNEDGMYEPIWNRHSGVIDRIIQYSDIPFEDLRSQLLPEAYVPLI